VFEPIRVDLNLRHMRIHKAFVAIKLTAGLPHCVKDHLHGTAREPAQRNRASDCLSELQHIVNQRDEVASHEVISIGCRFVLDVSAQTIQVVTVARIWASHIGVIEGQPGVFCRLQRADNQANGLQRSLPGLGFDEHGVREKCVGLINVVSKRCALPSNGEAAELGKLELAESVQHDLLDIARDTRCGKIERVEPVTDLDQVRLAMVQQRGQESIEYLKVGHLHFHTDRAELLEHPRSETLFHLDIPDRVKITEMEITQAPGNIRAVLRAADDQDFYGSRLYVRIVACMHDLGHIGHPPVPPRLGELIVRPSLSCRLSDQESQIQRRICCAPACEPIRKV